MSDKRYRRLGHPLRAPSACRATQRSTSLIGARYAVVGGQSARSSCIAVDGWTLKRSEGPRARNGLPGVVEESFEEVVVLVGHESINVAICERVNTLSEACPGGLRFSEAGARSRIPIGGAGGYNRFFFGGLED